MKSEFDFEALKKGLIDLPYRQQLITLLEVQTEYFQKVALSTREMLDISFYENCDLEIQKIIHLIESKEDDPTEILNELPDINFNDIDYTLPPLDNEVLKAMLEHAEIIEARLQDDIEKLGFNDAKCHLCGRKFDS